MLVPMTIHYVDEQTYGIWLTLSSIVSWLSFFDIGINNGLRNKLGESIANNDVERSGKLVSTTYVFLILIFIPLMLLLLVINGFIPWTSILKLDRSLALDNNINSVASIIIIYFCLRFVLSTINIILLADLKTALSSSITFFEQFLVLIILYLFTQFSHGNLLILSLILCLAPLLVLIAFSFFLFRNKYHYLIPNIRHVDFSLGRNILSVGSKFFIIQIAGIVLFQSANFIIIRNFGAYDVTNYNIAYKYFSIPLMCMTIFVSPLWSTVTNAYANKDIDWIIRTVNKYLKVAAALSLIGVLMLLCSSYIYIYWIGSNIEIPYSLSIALFIFNIVSVFGSIFCSVLNGLTRLKYQYIASLLAPFLFIFFCYIFIDVFKWGVASVVVAMTLSNFNAFLIAPIEYIYTIKHLKNDGGVNAG